MNELILEIMKVALEKNQRNKNTIFLTFHGHVNFFDIRVYEKGWKEGETSDYNKDVYMSVGSEDVVIKQLKDILDYLKSLEV